MASERYVVDASVAAKWFLNDEDHVDVAEEYLERLLADDIELHAPSILQYELGHSLIRAQRDGDRPLDANQSYESYQTFTKLPIVFHNLDGNTRLDVLRFAIRHYRGFYDSAYVCLAVNLDCKWLTSEKRYRRPLPSGFPMDHVLPLESLR